MKKIKFLLLLVSLLAWLSTDAKVKIYLIHGYGGIGLEFYKIQKAIKKQGCIYETFHYNSLAEDVDSVSKILYEKISKEPYDTLSFVTHSIGALVVRSMYQYLHQNQVFPFVHRMIMIAPPNKGTPVADFFLGCDLTTYLAGPNLQHLSTDSITGAHKFPLPKCEVGLIIGAIDRDNFLTIPLIGNNDGIVLNEHTKLGIETDIWIEEDSHLGLLFNDKVVDKVIEFLNHGKFLLPRK